MSHRGDRWSNHPAGPVPARGLSRLRTPGRPRRAPLCRAIGLTMGPAIGLAIGLGIGLALALGPTTAPAQPAAAVAGAPGAPGAPVGQAGGRPATAFSAQTVRDWLLLDLQLIQQTPGNSPPVAARTLAYTALALYEAVAPGIPGARSLAGQLNELDSLPWAQPDEPLHWPTVANATLATMARMLFPNATAENRQRIDLLERSLPLTHPPDFDGASLTPELSQRSEAFGKLMAMAVMTWARTDGGHDGWAPGGPYRASRERYVPPGGPGQWAPTPPDFGAALLPWWGQNRTLVLARAAECAAPAPLPYSEEPGSPFHREALEVYRIANAATQQQRQFALYWADDPLKTPTPAGHWVRIALDVLADRQATLAQAAATLVRLNLAVNDAFIAGWATKYATQVLRPVTYVQQVIDSRWTPQLMNTPPFPEYPSGHSVQSAAAATVLGALFGDKTAFTDNAHNDRGWGPRRFDSFAEAAEEAALSRLYAGIHFRAAVVGGQVQGRCVAERVLKLQLGG